MRHFCSKSPPWLLVHQNNSKPGFLRPVARDKKLSDFNTGVMKW